MQILALIGLIALVALLGLLRWRRRRAHCAAQALQKPPSPDMTLWRPPAREQLMQRQRDQERRRVYREQVSHGLLERRLSGAACTIQTSQPPPTAGRVTLNAARLDRKRQGLESLVTDLPSDDS